jgi:hypothetical protein
MASSISDTLAGLVSFGGTVLNPVGGAPLTSYDYKTYYDTGTPPAPTLPCLLAVPELGEQSGWQTVAFGGGGPRLDFNLEHYLLFSVIAGNPNFTLIMPDLLNLIKAYYTALKALPFLTAASNPATHKAAIVRFKIQRSVWEQVQYHSIIFKHELGLNL